MMNSLYLSRQNEIFKKDFIETEIDLSSTIDQSKQRTCSNYRENAARESGEALVSPEEMEEYYR